MTFLLRFLLRKPELLTTDEIVELASLFAREGVDKIRLTGGEPLVRPDVVEVVQRLKEIDGIKTVAMTTNALVLVRRRKTKTFFHRVYYP